MPAGRRCTLCTGPLRMKIGIHLLRSAQETMTRQRSEDIDRAPCFHRCRFRLNGNQNSLPRHKLGHLDRDRAVRPDDCGSLLRSGHTMFLPCAAHSSILPLRRMSSGRYSARSRRSGTRTGTSSHWSRVSKPRSMRIPATSCGMNRSPRASRSRWARALRHVEPCVDVLALRSRSTSVCGCRFRYAPQSRRMVYDPVRW